MMAPWSQGRCSVMKWASNYRQQTCSLFLRLDYGRSKISQLHPCRGKGVDKQTRQSNLVPHSKASTVWGCLQQHHRCGSKPLGHVSRLGGTSFKTICCASQPAQSAWRDCAAAWSQRAGFPGGLDRIACEILRLFILAAQYQGESN